MAKVYTMPKLILAAGTLALGISAGLYALAGGSTTSTTLTVVRQAPVKPSCVRGTKPSGDNITIVSETGGVTCYTFNDNEVNKGVFLKGTDVTRALDAQGSRSAGTAGHWPWVALQSTRDLPVTARPSSTPAVSSTC